MVNLRRRQSNFVDVYGEPLPGIVVKHDKNISPHAVQELCESVGWNRREPDLIVMALENSVAVVSLWDNEYIVGFGRATGDKIFNATLWDIVVRPTHQRNGLGKLVMKELLKQLDQYRIPLVTLYADPGTEGFYQRFGFLSDPTGAKGMFREKCFQAW
jgi:ribosomal protein S18 acetylase RimI-like enzyme